MNKAQAIEELRKYKEYEDVMLENYTKKQLIGILEQKRSSGANGISTTDDSPFGTHESEIMDNTDHEPAEKQFRQPIQLDELPPGYKRFKTQFSILLRDPDHPRGEINEDPSQTEPNLVLSMQQLVDRHVKGQPTGATTRQPLYFETYLPVIEDMTDLEAYRDHLKRNIDSVTEAIEAEKAASAADSGASSDADSNENEAPASSENAPAEQSGAQ